MYAELVYFEGAHFAHISLYQETARLSRLQSRTVDHFRGTQRKHTRTVGRPA